MEENSPYDYEDFWSMMANVRSANPALSTGRFLQGVKDSMSNTLNVGLDPERQMFGGDVPVGEQITHGGNILNFIPGVGTAVGTAAKIGGAALKTAGIMPFSLMLNAAKGTRAASAGGWLEGLLGKHFMATGRAKAGGNVIEKGYNPTVLRDAARTDPGSRNIPGELSESFRGVPHEAQFRSAFPGRGGNLEDVAPAAGVRIKVDPKSGEKTYRILDPDTWQDPRAFMNRSSVSPEVESLVRADVEKLYPSGAMEPDISRVLSGLSRRDLDANPALMDELIALSERPFGRPGSGKPHLTASEYAKDVPRSIREAQARAQPTARPIQQSATHPDDMLSWLHSQGKTAEGFNWKGLGSSDVPETLGALQRREYVQRVPGPLRRSIESNAGTSLGEREATGLIEATLGASRLRANSASIAFRDMRREVIQKFIRSGKVKKIPIKVKRKRGATAKPKEGVATFEGEPLLKTNLRETTPKEFSEGRRTEFESFSDVVDEFGDDAAMEIEEETLRLMGRM